jgi:ATP-dependent RNA helicase DeaD
MQRFMPLARNLAQAEDELAIVTMLLDDYYQQSLHTPPAQPAADIMEGGNQSKPKPKSKPKPQDGRPRSRTRKERNL